MDGTASTRQTRRSPSDAPGATGAGDGIRCKWASVVTAMVAGTLVLGGCAAAPAASGPATGPTPPAGQPQQVTVFAAASLTAAFTEIAELDPNLDVTLNFDGSPTLVDQIKGGAPADVLATADEANMAKATEAGMVAPAPTIFATNSGVLIVPKGNPAQVTGVDASLDGTRLVVCAPAVPCGATALEIAEAAGVTLKPVSEEQKVTDVRGKVSSGEADAGIVFATDAKAAGDAVETIAVDPEKKLATRYPMAIVTDAPHAEAARAFIDLVLSDRGQAVLASYGFGTP